MRESQSQTQASWYCRYRMVIVPKYRKKAIYGVLRKIPLYFARKPRNFNRSIENMVFFNES